MGNIGSRAKFVVHGETYYLLEAQGCHDCWDKWRIMLCDKDMNPISLLPIKGVKKTQDGKYSESYANPYIGQMDNETTAVVSYFMPKEGNNIKEEGELIYYVNFD